eukprot:TRINITY_DN5258_c0_g1_i1.p1 TRINITY_DN5258_c0_g1~~TRINITY_DN5258_c0_g1_i1.p1  ORF type:complete len:788 (-),score=243.71 TRINITY_DN5258_c0_g1_i1:289-2625(-)
MSDSEDDYVPEHVRRRLEREKRLKGKKPKFYTDDTSDEESEASESESENEAAIEAQVTLLAEAKELKDRLEHDAEFRQQVEDEEEQELMDKVKAIQAPAALISAQEHAEGKRFSESLETSWSPIKPYRNWDLEKCKAIRKKRGIIVEGDDIPPPINSFKHMRYPQPVISCLEEKGIMSPTLIQEQGMPVILSGRDMVGVASTGSGKSLAFVLPLLMRSYEEQANNPLKRNAGPIGMIICPSRELARQTHEIMETMATRIHALSVEQITGEKYDPLIHDEPAPNAPVRGHYGRGGPNQGNSYGRNDRYNNNRDRDYRSNSRRYDDRDRSRHHDNRRDRDRESSRRDHRDRDRDRDRRRSSRRSSSRDRYGRDDRSDRRDTHRDSDRRRRDDREDRRDRHRDNSDRSRSRSRSEERRDDSRKREDNSIIQSGTSGSKNDPRIMPKLRHVLLVGGEDPKSQMDALRVGVHTIVATPGRLRDLLKRKIFNLSRCSYVCLDEADRMLDLGFDEEIQEIFSFFKGQRQTLLFSATMPRNIRDFATESLVKPVVVNVGRAGAASLNVTQTVDFVNADFKMSRLLTALQKTPPPVIIFSESKDDVDDIHAFLLIKGVDVCSIHGSKDQDERTEAIKQFRSGEKDVLVASEVAAKGLDFPNIQHVINYDMPSEIENYIHRIGRTGRRGQHGFSTTFVDKWIIDKNPVVISDLKGILEEAKQAIPAFMGGEDEEEVKTSRKKRNATCAYCDGMGHTIKECPKLNAVRKQLSNQQKDFVSGSSRYGGDW